MDILIAYLLGIITAVLPKDIKRKYQKSETADENHEPQPPGNPERISTEVNLSAEEAKRYYSEEDKAYKLQRLIFFVNVFTLLALALYTLFTYRILCATQKSATAAKESADTSARQLELTERPWVDANIGLEGPLTFNVNGANIDLKITLRNTGHSPALSTYVHPITLLGHVALTATNYREEACRNAGQIISAYPQNGVALFPGYPFEQRETVTFTNQQSADVWKEKFGSHFPGQLVSPAIVVCIAYKPHFKSEIYHSSYIVDLYKVVSPTQMVPFFKIGEIIPAAKLRLILHDMGAINAD